MAITFYHSSACHFPTPAAPSPALSSSCSNTSKPPHCATAQTFALFHPTNLQLDSSPFYLLSYFRRQIIIFCRFPTPYTSATSCSFHFEFLTHRKATLFLTKSALGWLVVTAFSEVSCRLFRQKLPALAARQGQPSLIRDNPPTPVRIKPTLLSQQISTLPDFASPFQLTTLKPIIVESIVLFISIGRIVYHLTILACGSRLYPRIRAVLIDVQKRDVVRSSSRSSRLPAFAYQRLASQKVRRDATFFALFGFVYLNFIDSGSLSSKTLRILHLFPYRLWFRLTEH